MKKNSIILYNSPLSQKIFQNCEIFGEDIILEDVFGKKISGNEYKNLALNYAIFLKNKGVKKGDSIAIFIKDITYFSAICLAVLLVGAKITLLEKDYSKQIFEEKLALIKPDFLIIEKLLYTLLQIPFVKKWQKIDTFSPLLKYSKNILVTKNIPNYTKNSQIIFEKSDNIAESIIVFTGGTTKNPKGVVHTLESLEIMIERIVRIIGNSTKIFFADLPHFVLIGILCGAKVIVGKNNDSDKKFLKILKKYNIDTTFSPPYRFLRLIENNQKIPDSLKHICFGSSPIHAAFLEKIFTKTALNTKITCIYGMTEILPIAYIDGKEKLQFKGKGDLLGKIFDDICFEIQDDGELIIWGKGLFKKYFGQEIIKKHKTGDLVEKNGDYLLMKGRKKDMIIRKDYNIYPGLYEPIINKIEGIFDSAMVGIWDEKIEDEKIFLFIEGKNLDKKAIFQELQNGKNAIDAFALPDKIIFEKIPRKGRQNKIDKFFLQNKYRLGE